MNYGQREAPIDAAAIGQHGACATLSVIATFFSAGKLELLPQRSRSVSARIERELLLLSIDGRLQRDGPGSPCLCIAQHDKFKAESRKYIQQRSRSFAQERRSGWQIQGERS
jgi:hypothetical protein